MKQMILLYNFNRYRLQSIRKALAPLNVPIKNVSKKDFMQPVGYVAGIDGILPSSDKLSQECFTDEMLVMCGFGSEKIDLLLALLKQGAVEKVDLKAVITPSNVYWSSIKLYKEVKSDHIAMNG